MDSAIDILQMYENGKFMFTEREVKGTYLNYTYPRCKTNYFMWIGHIPSINNYTGKMDAIMRTLKE